MLKPCDLSSTKVRSDSNVRVETFGALESQLIN